jgi:hypothetical protein
VESWDATKKESSMCIRAMPKAKTLLVHITTVQQMSMFFESISGLFLQKVLHNGTSGSQDGGHPQRREGSRSFDRVGREEKGQSK